MVPLSSRRVGFEYRIIDYFSDSQRNINYYLDVLQRRGYIYGKDWLAHVAGFSLLFAQLQTQADPFDLLGGLASLQRVSRSPPTELFLRSALDNCDRLMRTPSHASISARSRGIVQLRRSATGSSSKGMTTRKAAALFTGAGPGATLAFSASTPPLMKSLRHRRTVSSRTPNASAIRGLVQPASVSSTTRAGSVSG